MNEFYKMGSDQVITDLGLEKVAVLNFLRTGITKIPSLAQKGWSALKGAGSWLRKIPGYGPVADFTRGHMLFKPFAGKATRAHTVGAMTGMATLPSMFRSKKVY